MIAELAEAAKSLVGDQTSSKEVADRATQACERLAKHFSRVLGETGVAMLLERSIMVASAEYPWLVAARSRDLTAFRAAMESQKPDVATAAFVAVLSAFVGLLERLIGEGLVHRLLDEVWPGLFRAKETP